MGVSLLIKEKEEVNSGKKLRTWKVGMNFHVRILGPMSHALL